MPHRFAEEIFIKTQQFRAVDHAVDCRILDREVTAEAECLAGLDPALNGGKRGIQRALGGKAVRHGSARGQDQVTVEEAGDEKIAVLIEPLVEQRGLAEVVGGRPQLAERLGRGVELMLVGKQGGGGDHREGGDYRRGNFGKDGPAGNWEVGSQEKPILLISWLLGFPLKTQAGNTPGSLRLFAGSGVLRI